MNKSWNNLGDLWHDSAWFRVSLAICSVGIALLMSSWWSNRTSQSTAAATAQGLASETRQALADDNLQLSPRQEELAREAIRSLTPAQRQHFEALAKTLRQTSNNAP